MKNEYRMLTTKAEHIFLKSIPTAKLRLHSQNNWLYLRWNMTAIIHDEILNSRENITVDLYHKYPDQENDACLDYDTRLYPVVRLQFWIV